VSTRYYFNKYYEREVDSAGKTLYYHYIYGDNGVVALHIANRTIPKDSSIYFELGDEEDGELGTYRSFDKIPIDLMYYIHTDHVGSYCAITNEAGQVVQRNSFDPWGNYAFEKKFYPSVIIPPDRGDTLSGALAFPITARGFTGHEHYPFFKIINMNGRLYDPVIARFFSPDQFVQMPEFTQSFNRYSYCINNPLKYVDPSGQNFVESFLDFIFMPARALTEGFMWIIDKINNNPRPAGYFNWSYLMGRTEPGNASTGGCPANIVPYGHPLYMSPGQSWRWGGSRFGTGASLGADNEWFNVTNRPILMKLSKRFLYSAARKLGIDPSKAIPEAYRTSSFVNAAKALWFPYAPSPSGGIRITTVPNKRSGAVQGFATLGKDGVFTGESIMFLDKENAFTNIEQLFYNLGHELVHVSQYKALTGERADLFNIPGFEEMLEHNADLFENFIGGSNPRNFGIDFKALFPDHHQLVDFSRFAWTYLYNKPF